MVRKILFALILLLGIHSGYNENETILSEQDTENIIASEIPEEYEATIVTELPDGFIPLSDSELNVIFWETQISFCDSESTISFYQTSVKNEDFIVKYGGRYYINASIYQSFLPQTVAENFPGPLSEWLGFYQYDETWQASANETHPSITYRLILYVHNNEVQARLTANGFQTNMHIEARTEGDETKLELYSFSASGRPVPNVKSGEPVLTLYKEDGVIKTQWGSISPVVEKPSQIYFQPTTSPWQWD